jgi:hypothetical protein
VPIRKQEPISSLPGWLFGTKAHRVKISGGQNVGDVERLSNVALTLHFAHAQRIAADAIGALSESWCIDVHLGFHDRFPD